LQEIYEEVGFVQKYRCKDSYPDLEFRFIIGGLFFDTRLEIRKAEIGILKDCFIELR
jgi:hypothetical protein